MLDNSGCAFSIHVIHKISCIRTPKFSTMIVKKPLAAGAALQTPPQKALSQTSSFIKAKGRNVQTRGWRQVASTLD